MRAMTIEGLRIFLVITTHAWFTLKQFFAAYLTGGGRPVSMPSQIVDDLWHEFILYTRDYQKFCRWAFGRLLHHTAQPGGGEQSPRLSESVFRSNRNNPRNLLWAQFPILQVSQVIQFKSAFQALPTNRSLAHPINCSRSLVCAEVPSKGISSKRSHAIRILNRAILPPCGINAS